MRRNVARVGQLAPMILLQQSRRMYAQGSGSTGRPKAKGKARIAPLVLTKQGSFFVNGQHVETSFSFKPNGASGTSQRTESTATARGISP